MKRSPRSLRHAVVVTVAFAASVGTGCVMKQTAGSRNSGQSRLMDDTFAGQNACNPENHKRPFIIEWDATDASSFESLTASDIVFVKYEGCSLVVLDECKNDSLAGDMGAYKPVEWTTGALETIDIQNTGELYAKLPLGEATLGARISGGEKFHMEYYVAGTRYATRDAVYESDLEGRYGCDSATHFVYAYNLGAFALGSSNEFVTEAGASAFGFGGGAGSNNSSKADKKGGDLAVCQADSATEIAGCKAPIRLSLRGIRPGTSPEAEAMAAPDTTASLSAAAAVSSKVQMSEDAQKYYEAAMAKVNAGDGKGCLKELDAHDAKDPDHKSTEPASPFGVYRAQCLMMSGKCDAGREMHRKWQEKHNTANQGPERLDEMTDGFASMNCRGKMSARDELNVSLYNLMQAATMRKESSDYCSKNYEAAKKAMKKAKPRGDDDKVINEAGRRLYGMAPMCFVKAGDCKKGWTAFEETSKMIGQDKVERSWFENAHKSCAPQ